MVAKIDNICFWRDSKSIKEESKQRLFFLELCENIRDFNGKSILVSQWDAFLNVSGSMNNEHSRAAISKLRLLKI